MAAVRADLAATYQVKAAPPAQKPAVVVRPQQQPAAAAQSAIKLRVG